MAGLLAWSPSFAGAGLFAWRGSLDPLRCCICIYGRRSCRSPDLDSTTRYREFQECYEGMTDAIGVWVNNIVNLTEGRHGNVAEEVIQLSTAPADTPDQIRETTLRLWSLIETEGRFWRDHQSQFPTLYVVALMAFSEVDSSGFVERVFSTCKNILALNRSSLDFDLFDDLVVLKHNKDLHSTLDDREEAEELLTLLHNDLCEVIANGR